jgi:hypothetical protein
MFTLKPSRWLSPKDEGRSAASVDCEVITPSLIPKKAGDKVKTDRCDAQKLAQS